MKFVIRKIIEREWGYDNYKRSHYEDKIYLNPYTYKDALRKISMIYDDMGRMYNTFSSTIYKWNIITMLVPVSDNFKSQTNWINTKSFLKYKG